jgi:hypothetical protein
MRKPLLTAIFLWLISISSDNFYIEEPIVINKKDLRSYIVVPTLKALEVGYKGSYSHNAVKQVLRTVAVESEGGYHLVQVGAKTSVGAKGIAQVEGLTHMSIWNHFLRYNPKTAKIVRGMAAQHLFNSIFDGDELSQDFKDGLIVLENNEDLDKVLISNLSYNIAICRLVYMIAPGPIPSSVEDQAVYWKRFYNKTGKGTVEKFIIKAEKYAGDL